MKLYAYLCERASVQYKIIFYAIVRKIKKIKKQKQKKQTKKRAAMY